MVYTLGQRGDTLPLRCPQPVAAMQHGIPQRAATMHISGLVQRSLRSHECEGER